MRGSVLRGPVRARRRYAAVAAVIGALVVAFGAAAPATGGVRTATAKPAYVPHGLLADARANPGRGFDVIVQANGDVGDVVARAAHGKGKGVEREFRSIGAASATLTGEEILELASRSDVVAVTPDTRLVLAGGGNGNNSSGSGCSSCPFEGVNWPYLTGVTGFWPRPGKKGLTNPPPQAPAIAVVDSGIEASNAFFGGRVVKQVDLTSLPGNSAGDGRGHGTFVAGLAAGLVGNWGGSSPTSKIVALDVVNDEGWASTSDVIAAADWIYRNKSTYGIRVANFSLTGTVPTSFSYDPLDKAVEKLWLSGVVVVTSAGNYGVLGSESGLLYAPGNDPFVITVGAVDMNNTLDASDDSAAPWSAYGHTPDGFAKPEVSAPGRYMLGTVPVGSQMPTLRPDRLVAAGWMWMSGTSFAAPVVAGVAADVLAVHPTWTPDQVKGALMLTALPLGGRPWSGGVGQVHAAAAAAVVSPPNPNAPLAQFLVADPSGDPTPVFDSASWASAASSSSTWSSASWTSASWTSAGWDSASWISASWTSASWISDTWNTASWASASWSDASWADLIWLP